MTDPTVRPIRLQLSRRTGFNLQSLSQATNGLPAVAVGRSTRWGNPYRLRAGSYPVDTRDAVASFRHLIFMSAGFFAPGHDTPTSVADVKLQLRGKNLACWCKPGSPCHADVLLEIANA